MKCLFLLFLSLVLVLSACSPPKVAEEPLGNADELVTVTNEERGFSITVPGSWKTREASTPIIEDIVGFQVSNGGHFSIIAINVRQEITLEEATSEMEASFRKSKDFEVLSTDTSKTAQGLEVKIFTYKSTKVEITTMQAYLVQGTRVYTISYTKGTAGFNEALPEVKAAIASITFAE